jgi:hypothetical protein
MSLYKILKIKVFLCAQRIRKSSIMLYIIQHYYCVLMTVKINSKYYSRLYLSLRLSCSKFSFHTSSLCNLFCFFLSLFSTGNGFIEGNELDGFLREFVSSANPTEVSCEVILPCFLFLFLLSSFP